MKDLKRNIQEIVGQSYALSFACVDGDTPYQVWLHYAGNMNTILVYSRRDRLHSGYIRENNKVAIAILPEQIPGYGVRGLTGQGTIRELADESEIDAAIELYQEKFGEKDSMPEQPKSSKAEHHAFYEIDMANYVVFDMHNYPGDSRQEYRV